MITTIQELARLYCFCFRPNIRNVDKRVYVRVGVRKSADSHLVYRRESSQCHSVIARW